MLEKIKSIIDSKRSGLHELSGFIWEHPELAWNERAAVRAVAEFMQKENFNIETGCFGVETAFKCEYGSDNGPVFAVASEYDALPELGHGCGHNLICVAGIATFLAVAELLRASGTPGKVVLLGTPAEEGAGGKVRMLANGCLKNVDAVIMAHPGAVNGSDNGSTAVKGLEVVFHGKAAHAAGSPEKGVNALDAVNLLFAAVGAYRQQMPSYALMHGVITNGGAAPNIIPDEAKCRFYLRTAKEEFSDELERRFVNMVRGAELMTDCTAEIYPFREAYRCRKPNNVLNQYYLECMKNLGLPAVDISTPGKGSSDFGDFSQVIPGIHPYFAVAPQVDFPGHSPEFNAAANTEFAFDSAMNSAACMAQIIWRFISDADFRDEVKKDFAK